VTRVVLSWMFGLGLCLGGSIACTSDLALGVDRSSEGSCSDCSDSCPPSAVAACDGGVLNAECECSDDDDSNEDADEVENEVEEESEELPEMQDPDETDEDAGDG